VVCPGPRVTTNPFLVAGKVACGENIPYPDATFDVVFSDNVLEHLAEPAKAFAEIARVLKPDGQFLLKTPHPYHYVPLIASIAPHCSRVPSFARFWPHEAIRKISILAGSCRWTMNFARES
jgi:SAM-dependent methyltransferase